MNDASLNGWVKHNELLRKAIITVNTNGDFTYVWEDDLKYEFNVTLTTLKKLKAIEGRKSVQLKKLDVIVDPEGS
jgi:hypothetical protein